MNTSTDSDFVPPTPPGLDDSINRTRSTSVGTPKHPKTPKNAITRGDLTRSINKSGATPKGATPTRYSLRSAYGQQRMSRSLHQPLPKQSPEASLSRVLNTSDVPLTYEAFSIIDVAANSELFKHFIAEWETKACYSLSLACCCMKTSQSGATYQPIGAKFTNKTQSSTASYTNENRSSLISVEENYQVLGLSVCWGYKDAYFISFCEKSNTGDYKNYIFI